jgi:predicted nucleic-acid-binding protein
MIAVDTNVLVHLLTGDDRKQAAMSGDLFAREAIWIAKTVLLETGWVLRSLYGFEEGAIRDAFTKLLGLKNVEAEDERAVAAALAHTARGVEFADALHLSSRPPDAAFVSFDRSFVRLASRAGVCDISNVPEVVWARLHSTVSAGELARAGTASAYGHCQRDLRKVLFP